jgi:hypothetical protein
MKALFIVNSETAYFVSSCINLTFFVSFSVFLNRVSVSEQNKLPTYTCVCVCVFYMYTYMYISIVCLMCVCMHVCTANNVLIINSGRARVSSWGFLAGKPGNRGGE